MRQLFLILQFLRLPIYANETSSVEVSLLKTIEEQVHKECQTCVVQMEILNKKVLEDIAVPDRVSSDHWKGQTNLLLQLGESSRIVTVNIRWMDKVVVANKNISQGQIIANEDIRVVEKDVTFLNTPYVQNTKQALGLAGKRVFQRGQIIDESMLKKPLAVLYGQTVKVQIHEGSLKVLMNGTAKGAGAIGDRIPIYVTETGKRLFGKIMSQNIVRVE
jgi:flagella basal body P-ring formation protein FlgA